MKPGGEGARGGARGSGAHASGMLELEAKGSLPVVKLWIAKLMMELGAAELMIRWARDGLMRK